MSWDKKRNWIFKYLTWILIILSLVFFLLSSSDFFTDKASSLLEKVGLTHSSGLRIRPRVAKEFGLKPRDSYDKYIAAVQLKIDEHIDKKRSI